MLTFITTPVEDEKESDDELDLNEVFENDNDSYESNGNFFQFYHR